MQAFFRQRLGALKDQAPDATFYLEVSGGTPAMTSMLLVTGAEVLGLAARPLYVSEHEEQPFSLDLGRRLVAESLCQVIREDLKIYAYQAAANTVRDNLVLLEAFIPARALLAGLDYARQRLNFNFECARQAIEQAPPGPWSAQAEQLAASLCPQQPGWLLHEIIYNAETRLEIGAYGDFLTRVFRFDEGALRHTVRRLGARLIDKNGQPDDDGEFFDPVWLDQVPQLKAYLIDKGIYFNDDRAPANRYVLNLVAKKLADRCDDTATPELLTYLGTISKLSGVRNKSFAVHTFDGVSRQRMVEAFTGKASVTDSQKGMQDIVAMLRQACHVTTGQPLAPDNPFKTEINAFCAALTRDGAAGLGADRDEK